MVQYVKTCVRLHAKMRLQMMAGTFGTGNFTKCRGLWWASNALSVPRMQNLGVSHSHVCCEPQSKRGRLYMQVYYSGRGWSPTYMTPAGARSVMYSACRAGCQAGSTHQSAEVSLQSCCDCCKDGLRDCSRP